MKRRGPYKRYQTDPNVSIPKQTRYNRRKRGINDDETDLTDDHGSEWRPTINDVHYVNEVCCVTMLINVVKEAIVQCS